MVGGRGFGARLLRLYLPLAFFLVAMLFPFYWMLITSIKPNRELYNARIMPLIVHQPTLKHYVDLLTQTNFLTWTYNTFLVAIVSTVVSLVLPPEKSGGRKIDGADPAVAAKEILKYIREEAKAL